MRHEKRNRHFNRVMGVLQILLRAGRELSVREIHERAQEFDDVEERTIRRDLSAIEECFGHALEVSERADDRGVRTRYYRARGTVEVGRTLVLTPSELLALYFARGALQPLRETALYRDLASFFGKLDALITPEGRRYLDEYASEIHFEPSAAWGLNVSPATLDTLRAACAEGHELSVTYQGAQDSAPRTRRLGPQFLYFSRGSLYLVAQDLETHGPVKVFAVPRIQSAEMLDAAYNAPEMKPDAVFSSAFGVFRTDAATQVVVRLSPPVAAFASERQWHPTQTLARLPGGDVELSLKVGPSPDVVNWILGFGPAAEVMSPPELREAVQSAAESVVARYGSALRRPVTRAQRPAQKGINPGPSARRTKKTA